MNRWLSVLFFLLLFATAHATSLQVQVETTPLRDLPSFLSPVIMDLGYGQKVDLVQEQADWKRIRVTGSKTTGWVHGSALTEKTIRLSAGNAAATGVDADELALAGKGFSEEVEGAYRAENQSLDYTMIDKMEAIVVSPEEAKAFLKEGGIIPKGDGK